MKARTLKAHVLVLLATLLIAGSFIASAKLAGIIHPISLTLLRFVGAAFILLPVILFKREWRSKVLPTLPRAMVISLFYALFFLCLFQALETTTSLNTGTLHTLVPFTTAILCLFIFKEKINAIKLTAYLFGAIGTAWVIFNGQLDLLLSFALHEGDFVFLVGALCMCLYSISMKSLYRNDHMAVLVFCILVGGSIWMALAMVLTGQSLNWHLLKPDSFLLIAYLVICATLVTVYLYQKSTVVLGPSRVMAYIYLNPVTIAVLLWLIDQTLIPAAVVPGILISTVATFILQREQPPQVIAG